MRKHGSYWVKSMGTWRIATFLPGIGKWKWFNSSGPAKFENLPDEYFEEINETEIPEPTINAEVERHAKQGILGINEYEVVGAARVAEISIKNNKIPSERIILKMVVPYTSIDDPRVCGAKEYYVDNKKVNHWTIDDFGIVGILEET